MFFIIGAQGRTGPDLVVMSGVMDCSSMMSVTAKRVGDTLLGRVFGGGRDNQFVRCLRFDASNVGDVKCLCLSVISLNIKRSQQHTSPSIIFILDRKRGINNESTTL
jgi:hypothetical protein